MQAVEDLGQRQRPHPRRGQLDRQRHTVQARADLAHRCGIVISEGEIGAGMAGPVGEQLDRLVGQRQRGHPPAHLTSDPDRLTAGRQQGQPRRPTEQRDDQLGAGIQQMLAVVQHHQHLTVANKPQQAVHGGAARLIGQPQRTRHRHRHQLGVGDRRQIHVPHPVGKIAGHSGRDLDRQPGFAHPARTGQRHHPVLRQQLPQLGQLCVAAHETGQLHRKISCRQSFRRAQRWKLVDQIGMA